jgi:hypothetical protein
MKKTFAPCSFSDCVFYRAIHVDSNILIRPDLHWKMPGNLMACLLCNKFEGKDLFTRKEEDK